MKIEPNTSWDFARNWALMLTVLATAAVILVKALGL